MTEQTNNEHAIEEKSATEKITPANLNLPARLALALTGCATAYFLIAAHFLFSVRAAHFLGDVSYIPPSILRYTGVVFQQGEVEAGAQIIFFVIWLILVVVSDAIFLFAPMLIGNFVIENFTDDEPMAAALTDNLGSGFMSLIPLALLSLLTLLIMPLESHHPAVDSTSLTQIGEMMSFGEFLFTMTQATVVISLVCFFVVLTVAVAYPVSELLNFLDDALSFFIGIFVGVCVGIAMIMLLGHYAYAGLDSLYLKTGNAYLTQFAVFGIYAALCAVSIMPWIIGDRKKDADKKNFASIAEAKAERKSEKIKNRQRANLAAN